MPHSLPSTITNPQLRCTTPQNESDTTLTLGPGETQSRLKLNCNENGMKWNECLD